MYYNNWRIGKWFCCNGSIKKDKDDENVIQLSGDQRDNVKAFLIEQEINKEDDWELDDVRYEHDVVLRDLG